MGTQDSPAKARAIGINHVALEVGDVAAALEFYGAILDFSLRGRTETMAFIDMGDQFLALSQERTQGRDADRHFGLVVDDRAALRRKVEEMQVEILPGGRLDFLDPWGNRVQVVEYRDIQFTKAPEVLDGMGLSKIEKSAEALRELADKAMAPR